ncbi:septal ring lytic transglycosylase RlpA family protein [Aquirufa sp. ROCK2-A2]
MHSIKNLIFAFLILLSFTSLSQDLGDESYGIASFYSNSFYNKKTANQELLKKKEFTAAHRVLPFNTLVEVTNIYNKHSIIVRINDRGPYRPGRIIDLTEAGAKKLNIRKVGLSKVKLKIIGFENEQMLIPYQHLEMETTPKFSKKFYQKTRLKYKKKYRLKRKIKNRKYLKKGKKKSSRKKKNVKRKNTKRKL